MNVVKQEVFVEKCPGCESEMQNRDGFGHKTSTEWWYCHNQGCVFRLHSFRGDQLVAIRRTRDAAIENAMRKIS